jgi:hypothetical protein
MESIVKTRHALAVAFLLMLVVAEISISAPTQLTIQGRLTDIGGNPISGLNAFEFRIYDAQFGGLQVWPASGFESQNIAPDSAGLWSASVGQVTPLTDAVFSDSDRWLQITAAGMTLPRVRLSTSPYAFRVATVDGASGGTILSKVSIGATNAIPGEHTFAAGTANLSSGTGASVTGGNSNSATGNYSVVGGGTFNEAGASRTAVGGGGHNSAQGEYAYVGGGSYNSATGDFAAVVAGGGTVPTDGNLASGMNSFVGGGKSNEASDIEAVVVGGAFNRAEKAWSVVGGGHANIASGDYSVVAGGRLNYARAASSFVGGGGAFGVVLNDSNAAHGDHSGIVSGAGNLATGSLSFIGAGRNNTSGGVSSAVLAGRFNSAAGDYASIPGGYGNSADGDYSLAAGNDAHANHHRTFVWSDGIPSTFASTATNQFLIRASGGVGIGTNAPTKQLEVLDDSANALTFPIKVTNQGTTAGTATGIIFQVDAGGDRGKGAIAYERSDTWNRGDFHFLQEPNTGSANVGLANKVMTIRNNGNVGIGQSAPGNILTIQQGSATDPVADAWTMYSSRRWKKNIVPIVNALEKVECLRGVEYDNINDNTHCIGLIAEEVGEVIPEVVQYEANGVDAASLDYARLVALLIEAVKEQQVRIESLESRLEEKAP